MSAELIAIITGLVALSTGLLRLVEGMWKNYRNKAIRTLPVEQDAAFCAVGLSQSERSWLKEVHDIISRTDDKGTYLVYTPRDMGELQKDIISALNGITMTQEKMTFILEQLVKKLDK